MIDIRFAALTSGDHYDDLRLSFAENADTGNPTPAVGAV
jgi:hypothetical protein